VAKTGHAYLAENRANKAKEKPKTQGTAAVAIDKSKNNAPAEDETEGEELPLALPTEYNLGRQHLKVCASNSSPNDGTHDGLQVFLQILDDKEDTGETTLKKGQLK
jgi:hypothetical protein